MLGRKPALPITLDGGQRQAGPAVVIAAARVNVLCRPRATPWQGW